MNTPTQGAGEAGALEGRITEALHRVAEFFTAVRGDASLPAAIVEEAGRAEAALAGLQEEWLELQQEWQALDAKVRELRISLSALEEVTGQITSALNEEEWPAGA